MEYFSILTANNIFHVTGTVDIATKRNHTTTGSSQSQPHFTKENNYAFECLIF